MPSPYRIRLSAAERRELIAVTRRGHHPARTMTRARALLLANRGLGDGEIATALGTHARTIQRLRRRACEAGIMAALQDRPRPGGTPKLDGHQEALLVALACSDPPLGRSQWTMQCLADRLVELEVVDAISDETVRRTLKKTTSNPGRSNSGVSPR